MSDAYGDMPDIAQLAPASGRVGEPASGTYGEKTALADLQRSLPAPTTPAAGAAGPVSAVPGPMPLPPPSGALPRSIMAPSTRPYEPMATPLAPPVPIGETLSMQQRQLLESYVRNPQTRETTRAWAQSAIDAAGNR